jgi:hypothetical protein
MGLVDVLSIRSQIIWMVAGAGATIVTGVIVFFVQKAFGG